MNKSNSQKSIPSESEQRKPNSTQTGTYESDGEVFLAEDSNANTQVIAAGGEVGGGKMKGDGMMMSMSSGTVL